jgi:hypothetical protein
MRVSDPVALWGDTYAMAAIRGKNVFGGPIIGNYIFLVSSSDGEVIYAFSSEDFLTVKEYELTEMKMEQRPARDREFAVLCALWGISRDVER